MTRPKREQRTRQAASNSQRRHAARVLEPFLTKSVADVVDVFHANRDRFRWARKVLARGTR